MAYVSVDQIVREKLADEGDTLHRYSDYLRYALRGVRELSMDILTTAIKTVLVPINDNNTIDFPKDYIDYTKIGICGADGNIMVLGLNDKICLAEELDSCGAPSVKTILSDSRRQNEVEGEVGYYFSNYFDGSSYVGSVFGHGGGYNQVGSYRVNNEAQQIQLSSSINATHIVLEHCHNGINSRGATMINEMAYEALHAWINWKKEEARKSAYRTDKQHAKDLYYEEVYKLRVRMHSFTLEEFKQAYRKGYSQTFKN